MQHETVEDPAVYRLMVNLNMSNAPGICVNRSTPGLLSKALDLQPQIRAMARPLAPHKVFVGGYDLLGTSTHNLANVLRRDSELRRIENQDRWVRPAQETLQRRRKMHVLQIEGELSCLCLKALEDVWM